RQGEADVRSDPRLRRGQPRAGGRDRIPLLAERRARRRARAGAAAAEVLPAGDGGADPRAGGRAGDLRQRSGPAPREDRGVRRRRLRPRLRAPSRERPGGLHASLRAGGPIRGSSVTVVAPVSDTTPEEYRRATEVTYLGSVWGTMTALRRMRARDSGVIVQVGSALAYRGIPLQAAYCGGKHALQGFLESVRAELLHDDSHVHLTMVQLPALNTPQFTWS